MITIIVLLAASLSFNLWLYKKAKITDAWVYPCRSEVEKADYELLSAWLINLPQAQGKAEAEIIRLIWRRYSAIISQ